MTAKKNIAMKTSRQASKIRNIREVVLNFGCETRIFGNEKAPLKVADIAVAIEKIMKNTAKSAAAIPCPRLLSV